MKRLIYLLSVLPFVFGPSLVLAQTYIVQPGDTLSQIAQSNGLSLRAIVTLNDQIANPNLIFPGQAVEVGAFPILGGSGGAYTPVTGYQSRLTQYTTAAATSLTVASTKDPAGNEIALSDITGSSTKRVYLTIEPGGTREEIVMCTGKSVGTWSSCTRGLSFQGGDQTASTTLAFAHNAGVIVIISNVGQFFNQYVSVDGNQTIEDVKTFKDFPRVTSTSANPTVASQLATKYYVDTVGAGGFTANNVSSTLGLQAISPSGTACPSTAACVGMNVSSTKGLAFDSSGKVYVNASSTSLAFDSDGKLYTVTSTPIIPGYFGDGNEGASTTAAGTTTLAGDVYFTRYVVATGTTVVTNGYRIFASEFFTNNGKVINNGGNGGNGANGDPGGGWSASGTPGVGAGGGFFTAGADGVQGGGGGSFNSAGSAGFAGIAGIAGQQPTSTFNAIGVAGSVGSTGGAGGSGDTRAGGAGGAGGTTPSFATSTVFSRIYGSFVYNIAIGATTTQFSGSSGNSSGGGGGSGGSDSSTAGSGGAGGGSGGSGGYVAIYTRVFINNWLIEAKGGAGGNGGNGGDASGGNACGGGGGSGGNGGNGGVIMILAKEYTNLGNLDASPGAGGGLGTGGAGSTDPGGANGVAGTVGKTGKTYLVTN